MFGSFQFNTQALVSPVAFAITAISPGFVNCFAKTAAELYTGATKISFNVSQAAKGHVLLFLEKTASLDGELRGNSYPSGMKSLQGHSSPTHLLFSSNFTLESLYFNQWICLVYLELHLQYEKF